MTATGPRYLEALTGSPVAGDAEPLIGWIEGEGIGPELMVACRTVLDAVEAEGPVRFRHRQGGAIGKLALAESGRALTEEVAGFCRELFADNGALLCGPGGERFVYDLRRQFELYCKLVPLRPFVALADTGPLRPEAVRDVDILLVRENLGGLYQGEFSVEKSGGELEEARHSFGYTRRQVADILFSAAQLATARRGALCVVTKPGGAPSVSRLWATEARRVAATEGVALSMLEVDNAGYQLVANARAFDVVVAPNMFGDMLGDGAALLLASRGMSYSANFSHAGHAVYQTGHGAAHDLAGTDRANPLGQLQAMAMMLHESFGFVQSAEAILTAIDATLAAGLRTPDIATPGCQVVGTQAMARAVAERIPKRESTRLRTSA